LMDSEVTNLAQVKAFDSSDYATAAQGTTANAALPKAGGTMTGNLSIDKEDPAIVLTDSSSSRTLMVFNDNNNSVVRASGPLLLQVGSQSAITIDASRNTVLAGTLGSGTITSTGDISANSGKVRMGNPTLLSGRSSIRIDSNGDSFADLVFGDNVTSTGWTDANWAISSRSSSESNSLKIYRGSGQPSPYNSEHVLMEFKQNNVVSVNSTLQINNNTVIDSSRNLTNIGTISSGRITTTAGLCVTIGIFKPSSQIQMMN
jgi:hypothetical protein